jgi:hypothetical protein
MFIVQVGPEPSNISREKSSLKITNIPRAATNVYPEFDALKRLAPC